MFDTSRRSGTLRLAFARAILALAAAALFATLGAAAGPPLHAQTPTARYVVDGADLTVFTGMSASIRFRIQNNTPSDAPFAWTLSELGPAEPQSVVVPARGDALIVLTSPLFTTPGERRYDLFMRQTGSEEILRASLSVVVVEESPAVRTNEDNVVVSGPIQKPVTIIMPVDPGIVRGPRGDGGHAKDGAAGSASAMPTVSCFATAMNPDPLSAEFLFDLDPVAWTVPVQPGFPVQTSVTISAQGKTLPCGTMNTISVYVVAGGDTVMASGQAIYRDDCWGPVLPPGGDDPGGTGVPVGQGAGLAIRSAEPNPATTSVSMRFDLAHAGDVLVAIHDVQGRLVRELSLGALAAGPHTFVWDGRREDGVRVASGAYWVRLGSGEAHDTLRVVFVRR